MLFSSGSQSEFMNYTSMAQLVRATALDAFGISFAHRPDHTHTKDLNYEVIYLW